MKKYLYFVIPIIILIIIILSFVWLYPNKEDENSAAMNEIISEIPEANDENINVIETEITSPEILEKEELVKESEPEKVDEVVTNKTEKSTTSSPVSDASTKTTSVSKKETSTESTKKEETKVEEKVENKKEETKPSLPQTTEPTTPKQESPISNDNTKEEVEKEETVVRCTTNHNHSIGVGNCGKWFNSASEGIAEYNSIILSWGTKWENFEIDNDTYYANCPSGYQYIDCMYCGKYTFDYYYREVEK